MIVCVNCGRDRICLDIREMGLPWCASVAPGQVAHFSGYVRVHSPWLLPLLVCDPGLCEKMGETKPHSCLHWLLLTVGCVVSCFKLFILDVPASRDFTLTRELKKCRHSLLNCYFVGILFLLVFHLIFITNFFPSIFWPWYSLPFQVLYSSPPT